MKYIIMDGSNSELGLHREMYEDFKKLEFDTEIEANKKSATIPLSYVLEIKK